MNVSGDRPAEPGHTAVDVTARVVASVAARAPEWHWVPLSDGRRHAVVGKQVDHAAGEVIEALCGVAETPSEWTYARLQYPSCRACWAQATCLLDAG